MEGTGRIIESTTKNRFVPTEITIDIFCDFSMALLIVLSSGKRHILNF